MWWRMATSTSSSKAAYNERFAHMAALDSWPKKWRELAYEYGFKIVEAMYGEGGGYDAVKADLETWAERKQAAHERAVARGDYMIPKSAFFAGVGGFKTATERGLPKQKISFSI